MIMSLGIWSMLMNALRVALHRLPRIEFHWRWAAKLYLTYDLPL